MLGADNIHYVSWPIYPRCSVPCTCGLASRRDEVKRRCRTVLQSRAERLPRTSGPIPKDLKMHITPWLQFRLSRSIAPSGSGGGTSDAEMTAPTRPDTLRSISSWSVLRFPPLFLR